jgi:uncharacterized protein
MPPLSLLIKPASSLCNLRCRYCFYHALCQDRTVPSHGLMAEDVQEAIVRRVFAEADDQVTLAFQGGEPTLCGLPFYERLIEQAAHYNRKRLPVHYALQTNGQLIDQAWARFFAKHQFLIGLSLDGYKDLHDSVRIDAAGAGSFTRTLQAAAWFNKEAVEYNILAVITAQAARHAEKIYRFMQKNDFRYLQFIPCLAPLGRDAAADPHALTSERYGSFLLRLFDLWYEDWQNGRPVSIRLFDNWVRLLSGEYPEQCGLSGSCSCQMVIEADGGVYPCDFYVLDEWRLGSVLTESFADLVRTPAALRFVADSRQHPTACRDCRWYPLCRAGCRRDRIPDPQNPDEPAMNRFCQAYQMFFAGAVPRLERLANTWRQSSCGVTG